MKKSSILIGLLVVIALVLGGYYFAGKAHAPTGDTHALNAAAYPLYAGAVWGVGKADTQEGLSGYTVTANPSNSTNDISSITQPFEQYYQEKLTADGWTVDNALAAGGPGSSLTAYRKGGTYIVIGYTTKFEGGGINEPVQCPCSVTLGIFSGSVTTATNATPDTNHNTTGATQTDSTSIPIAPSPAIASTPATHAGVSVHYADLDLTAIPLGDGHVSTAPKIGYIYSCTTTFTGGGAMHSGDWITGDTWDLTKKIAVEGAQYWSTATFSNVVSGAVRTLSGNGLPVGEPTGTFPIASSDPAYQYDRNPNGIAPYTLSYALPANPTFAKTPSCLPLGQIGYALDGVAIFDALDDAGRDAGAHEVQDSCDGHPQGSEMYHYHSASPCIPKVNANNTVVGFALDGFPITSLHDANGHYYTNDDLDACHGMTSTITFPDGSTQTMYHYVLTEEYPYTLGCFMGTPVATHQGTGSSSTPASGGTPPAAAVAACSSKTSGSACSFTTPNGTLSGTCKTPPNQSSLACVPQ